MNADVPKPQIPVRIMRKSLIFASGIAAFFVSRRLLYEWEKEHYHKHAPWYDAVLFTCGFVIFGLMEMEHESEF